MKIGKGLRKKLEKNKAVKARMEKNLEDRQRAYGPGFTSDGLPQPTSVGFSELLEQEKKLKPVHPKFIETRFTKYDGHPQSEGGIHWEQGGLPGLGKRR